MVTELTAVERKRLATPWRAFDIANGASVLAGDGRWSGGWFGVGYKVLATHWVYEADSGHQECDDFAEEQRTARHLEDGLGQSCNLHGANQNTTHGLG